MIQLLQIYLLQKMLWKDISNMDIELLKRAKSYIDDMSNGINPITKAKV